MPPGAKIAVTVKEKTIAIFNLNGKFYAIDNTCGHRGGPLHEGDLDANLLSCPWHGFQFDITTGHCATNPAIKQQTYPVKTEGDDVLVEV